MYLDHFGLAVNPFGLSPKLEFLFKSEAFEESLAHLLYGIDNSEAITMITGAIGTGKTMVLQFFMTNLNQNFQWALVTNTQVNSLELLKLILDDLGVAFPRGCDKSELLILFKDFLVKTGSRGQRVMIIIDEAQNMDREVLEEIRLLTNLGQGNIQPVQVILVGQPELEMVVNRPDLAQLRQRIRVHYRLEPLSREEVGEYLDHRMAVAGCKQRLFKSGAAERIFEFSGGVPRLVNSLAGQALLSAFVAGRKQVLPGDVTPPHEEVLAAPRPAVPPPAAASDAARERGVEVPAPKGNPGGTSRKEFANRRRTGGWGVALVVLVLVGAVMALFLWGDVQGLKGRFLSRSSGEVTLPVAAPIPLAPDTVASSEPEEIRPDAISAVDSIPIPEPASLPQERFYVQVASFRTKASAERWCRELETLGFETLVQDWMVSGKLWRKVLIGPYPDQTSAREHLDLYPKPEGENYFPISAIQPDSGS